MVSFPSCKINLGLNILRKRPDGYHDIVTCFYPVPWYDILEIVPARDFSFQTTGHMVPGAAVDNLCVKAYHLLKQDHDLPPVSIHLHKILPLGAGLGGGSADGAFTLKTLSALFDLPLTDKELKTYAAALGSDCAFFIENTPAIGTGRGEELEPVPVTLRGKHLVIVKPEAQVSTAQAYAGVTPKIPEEDLRDIVCNRPVHEWRDRLLNDFEHTVFKDFPVIEAIQQRLYASGALYASMSGSGSAVYGIFEHETDLKEEFAEATFWSGMLS